MNKLLGFIKYFDRSSKILIGIFLFVIFFTIAEIYYFSFQSDKKETIFNKKKKAISLIQLPDLALVTETIWLRHRSISNIFSVFPEDGTLLDYYPSSFIYNVKMNYRNLQKS